jgi:heavy metal sensor kinase
VRLSIRWRLTLWNTAALAVLLAGFAGLFYGLLRHALFEQADARLATAFGPLSADTKLDVDPAGRFAHWVEEFKEHLDLFCVVYRPDGSVFARTAELAGDSVPSPPPMSRGNDPWVASESLPLIGRQRMMAARLRAGGGEYIVLLMAPLASIDHELEEVRVVLWTAGAAGLILAAGLGYALSRKALAPLEALRRATDEITADRLDRRLPVGNPSDELGRLTRTVNAMIARLERSFAEVRRFTADASHELRTPLTAIRVETEVALGQPSLQADQRQLLGSILEECDRLTRLTDQLLTLAREDAGAATRANKPVDLTSLAAETAEAMRPLADANGLSLTFIGPAAEWVAGDESRLRQVFYNLLDNAIKYTPTGGAVEVRVESRDGAAVATVRDTGEGIAPEHLPRAFDRFYRVDKARSRELGGTGLGLSIARGIVAAHGGTIELDSTPGRGTACVVRLPATGSSF